MVHKMRSTLEGISTATEHGMKQRAQGEKELAQRQATLSQELPQMDELRDRLLSIKDNIKLA
jgi:uncharacterized protein YaaN involved in tellurite resistance